MSLRVLAGFAGCALLLSAADKKIEPVKAGNEAVEARGLAVVGKEAVLAALGLDPGVEIIAIEVEVRPRSDDGVTVTRDDFVLISRRDGQRSPALHPSQIAGSGSIRVSTTAQGASGGMLGNRRGPIWGGMPGTGDRPRRIGGDNDVSSVTEAATTSEVVDKKEMDENPVLSTLKKKELPQGKTVDSVKGYLYYIFDGKHKVKDLELMYKTPQGTLMLDFQK